MTKVGVISDIHGNLTQEVIDHLQACEYIVCAGDTEDLRLIEQMRALAPLTVVRGNCDWRPWAEELPKDALLRVEDVNIYVLHNLHNLSFAPDPHKIDVVVYGHTHVYKQYYSEDVLYLNPGSMSEPRQGQSPHMYILEIEGKSIHIQDVDLATSRSTHWW